MKRPFLCLQAAPEACDLLLAAIDDLSTEQPPARRTLSLSAPDRPNSITRIRLLLSPASEDLTEMSLLRKDDAAVFEFTLAGLKKFGEAVAQWRGGAEDF